MGCALHCMAWHCMALQACHSCHGQCTRHGPCLFNMMCIATVLALCWMCVHSLECNTPLLQESTEAVLAGLEGGAPSLLLQPCLPSSKATARAVHDALLATFQFGYMPPLRHAILITLQHPSHVNKCYGEACTRPGCKGNRLEALPDGSYLFTIPHHKNLQR